MTSAQRFVIVGAGLAGAKLAQQLRDNDFSGHISLVGAEDRLPYERPPLSKDYLAANTTVPEFTVHDAAWYRDHNVELLLGTEVTAVDRGARTVTLPDGSALPYDKLALATGAAPRSLPVPGADAPGVYTLRTVEDSDALVELFGRARRLVVVGAGWIGLEVTAATRAAGVAVTVVEGASTPLAGALGPEMGEVFADLHREHDVQFRFDARVEEITVSDGRASGVRLADGTTFAADAVLVAVGARPRIELAEAAGLPTGTGILVDAGLTSSDPNIVAVGDIAEQDHPVLGRRVRVEHWANALNQPAVAARTMLGQDARYDRLPYFFTDQYDLGMEYTGYAAPGDYERVVVRGDLRGREFVAFWLDDRQRVLAGMNVNIWDVGDRIKELILSGDPVDPQRLADASTPL